MDRMNITKADKDRTTILPEAATMLIIAIRMSGFKGFEAKKQQ